MPTALDEVAGWPAERFVGRASALKLGMWLFLISDAFSFTGLLVAYGVLRAAAPVWWPSGEPALGIGFTAALTFLLICSSLSMALAVDAARSGQRNRATAWVAITALAGGLFLLGQFHEYFGIASDGLIAQGLRFGGSHRASTFFVITSFHAAHVLTGVILLLLALVRTRGARDATNFVESVGLFWHFVDLVWILVFTFVYLIPASPGASP
ncbi:MAG TPA: cytochrome c oxidase subunit 3 [Polyangia bacterium]